MSTIIQSAQPPRPSESRPDFRAASKGPQRLNCDRFSRFLTTAIVWLWPLAIAIGQGPVSGTALAAGPKPEPDGASSPKPYTDARPTRSTDYKRWGQYAVKRLTLGDRDGAEETLRRLLRLAPDDPDLLLLLASTVATAGEAAEAERLLTAALDAGLPPERLLVGPDVVTGPLQDFATVATVRDSLRGRPLHGPLLGDITDRSAKVWLRTAEPAAVTLIARPLADDRTDAATDSEREFRVSGRTTAWDDRTVVLQWQELQPATRYRYQIIIDDGDPIAGGEFRTFATAGQPAQFSLAFGGGAGYHPPQERVWDTIGRFEPDAVLLLGDNIYSDDPETTEVQRYSYYRRQSRPEFRRLFANIPVFSIWDDHDFGTDDSWGGAAIETPVWKRTVWNTFRQNWANPGYGGGHRLPGVWYDFSIADVDFFMLDGRYYRTDAGRFGGQPQQSPTMLGPEQNARLREWLLASDATFRVIVSPVPWDFRAKSGTSGLDTWRGYADERESLFAFLSQHQIGGVVLMSADRHRSDAWKIEREDDYPLYEFNSSRLTNDHVHPTMDEAIFSYNEKQSFGHVMFDTTSADPSVTYQVISIDGETVHSLKLLRSQLEPQQ